MSAVNGGESVKSAANTTLAGKQQQQHHLKSSSSGKALDGTRKQAGSPVDGQPKKSQPKAWTGSNPSIRPSSVNGPPKSHSPGPAPAQTGKSSPDAHAGRHAHDRLLFMLSQLVGMDVTIALRSGDHYAGVYSGLSASQHRYVMKMVRQTRSATQQQVNGSASQASELLGEGDEHTMSFEVNDTVNLEARDISVASSAALRQNGSATSSFMTDTQISRKEAQLPHQRELKRWEPGPDSAAGMSLEDTSGKEWDQFAVNESMYGVSSTYDENIYTTAIDRSNPAYRQREAEAERIAREIEGSAPANAHVAEERRRDAHRDDMGGDEEEKYSGVRRDASALPKRTAGAYIPPSQRPVSGAPSVPGAPFDPAIISSQIKATPSPAPAPAPAPQPVERKPSDLAAERVSTEAGAEPHKVVPEASKKKENTTEDRVRDTADAFKQFANTEKLRLRGLQEAKRMNAKQEKNVKLNDLKKFAANFKLKSRVPDDLVPILAKDREKQLEIQTKAEQAYKDEEQRAKERDADKVSTVASPAPSSSVSQAASGTSNDQRASPALHQQRGPRLQPQVRGPAIQGQHQSSRVPSGQRFPVSQLNGRQQPLPGNLHIPPHAPAPTTDMPMSPSSATRLNVNAKAFEFRPGASAFTPTGSSPSPHRSSSRVAPSPSTGPKTSFFDKKKSKETKPLPPAYDPLRRLVEADYTETEKSKNSKNGGIPHAHHTMPTWKFGKDKENHSHVADFPRTQAPSQGPSPMHTPNPNQMPHAHQLPPHMQHPTMPMPNHRQPFYGPPQAGHGPSFDPRLQQQFGPNGSVQNSPRAQHIPVAPFNGQMPPMQQFPGQPMPNYGMSPSMQYRQPIQPGGPMMMPGQPQHGQMMPMRPYPGGPPFNGPQMGGQMMMQNPSQGYMNGSMPQQGYGSPMHHAAQPHIPQIQQHGGPGNFSGSPRPPMMAHQGSHQGSQPGVMMQGAHHFGHGQGQPHPYQLQSRAMSGGYPQMTPRQHAALPNQPSPGMGVVAQGDEGK